MFLAVDVIIPSLAVFQATIASFAEESKHLVGLHISCNCHGFAQLGFRLEFTINWCQAFSFNQGLCFPLLERRGRWFGLLLGCFVFWQFKFCATVLIRLGLCFVMQSFHL